MRSSDAAPSPTQPYSRQRNHGISSASGLPGLEAINRLLDAERTEASSDAALHQALHTGFSGLDDATISYLRQTYLH
jgi:hypothetical protein